MKPQSAKPKLDERRRLSWKSIDYGFSLVARGLELILALAFIAAVLLNFINAADRYLLKKSIVGSDEVQVFIMVWMTFVGAAVVSWRQQHLRMDVLVSRFPRPVRIVLRAAELVLVAALMAILAPQSAKYATQMYIIDRRSDLASLPMWLPHMALAFGFALIGLITLRRLAGLLVSPHGQEERPAQDAMLSHKP